LFRCIVPDAALEEWLDQEIYQNRPRVLVKVSFNEHEVSDANRLHTGDSQFVCCREERSNSRVNSPMFDANVLHHYFGAHFACHIQTLVARVKYDQSVMVNKMSSSRDGGALMISVTEVALACEDHHPTGCVGCVD
jgi:hypothetical protein